MCGAVLPSPLVGLLADGFAQVGWLRGVRVIHMKMGQSWFALSIKERHESSGRLVPSDKQKDSSEEVVGRFRLRQLAK
jgi:hypothetical protein